MPKIMDVPQLIKDTPTSEGEHLLILIDELSKEYFYCLFMPGNFTTPSPDAVHLLFEDSMRILSHPTRLYVANTELPLLDQIGPYEVTIVERHEDGTIDIKDGRGEPVESHLGVGG